MNDQQRHYENKLAYEIDSWDLKSAIELGEYITVVDVRSEAAYQNPKPHLECYSGRLAILTTGSLGSGRDWRPTRVKCVLASVSCSRLNRGDRRDQ